MHINSSIKFSYRLKILEKKVCQEINLHILIQISWNFQSLVKVQALFKACMKPDLKPMNLDRSPLNEQMQHKPK